MKEVIIIVGVFLMLIGFAGYVGSLENKEPCEFFKNTPAKSLPARCISFYNVRE